MKKKRTIIVIVILILLAYISGQLNIKKSAKNSEKTSGSTKAKDKYTTSKTKYSSLKYPAKIEKDFLDAKSDNNKASETTMINIEAPHTKKWGNTPGNILNHGFFAFQDGYLYFNSPNLIENSLLKSSYPIYRTKEDGITALTSLKAIDAPVYINLVSEWIYFCTTPNGELYRMKINGTELEVISTTPTSNLIIYDNVLYYIQNNNIYKSSINNLQEKQLIVEKANYFTLSEDGKNIFYCSFDNNSYKALSNSYGNSIYSIETNGKNKKQIFTSSNDTNIESIFVYKNYLYFTPVVWDKTTMSVKSHIYIDKLDYTSSNPTVEEYISLFEYDFNINLYENYLYYTKTNFNVPSITVFRRNLDDNSEEKLTVDNVYFLSSGIFCFDDKVYLTASSDFPNSSKYCNSLYCLDFQKKSILQNKGLKMSLSETYEE
ncbi:hypothetical protein N3C_1088 [Clostridium sp. N3C]|uniref:DUF5050 domain-containing protein n=1 Tax=Clostridium sp. N3C TaxID=1776758 RepID=UPI00092E0328|nr:DUF5050 domain-containing protein [Clostridium sp. N3C]SCN23050.1 hypothetical protein N3C_1088 [Clostridium sp. N3C]